MGDSGVDTLLILSQVVLSLQLPFALVPLIHFTSDRRKMGEFATPLWGVIAAWTSAALLMGLNFKMVFDSLMDGIRAGNPVVQFLLAPMALALVPFLGWLILAPVVRKIPEKFLAPLPTPAIPKFEIQAGHIYKRVAICLEASTQDEPLLAAVLPLAGAAGAEVLLIHVAESAPARFLGQGVLDEEARGDAEYLERIAEKIRAAGLACSTRIGAGEPEHEIARIAGEAGVDLIIAGSHGHRILGDIFHGSTVAQLKHLTAIPVLSIRTPKPGRNAPPAYR
jgi:manganese transport protein